MWQLKNNYKHMKISYIITFLVLHSYMLVGTNAWAQSAPIGKEKVQVFLSASQLITGEDLWLDINVSLDNKPSPVKVVYTELLDREGTAVSQQMLGLDRGQARGYLSVPTNLPSDHYLFRVYTRSSPYTSGIEGVFHKILPVINPEIAPPAAGPLPQEKPLNPKSISLSISNDKLAPNEQATVRWQELNATGKTLKAVVRHMLPLQQAGSEINWEAVYDDKAWENPSPIPEIYGHVIKGRTVSTPIDTSELFYLTAHGKASHLFLSKPNIKGELFFETGAFRHFDYVVVQSGKSREQVNFVITPPFWPARPNNEFQLPRLVIDPILRERIRDRALAKSVNRYYHPKPQPPPKEFANLINPDHSYLLDDYNRFDDMATVIREYVPHVLVRRQNRKTLFRTYNKPHENLFDSNPLLLIDAMPVFDADAFANFNPWKIKRLDLLTRYFFYEKEIFEGVISLVSFENDFGEFDLPKSALFIEYEGIQIPVEQEFTLPPSNERIPDFRNVLLWEPALSPTSESITFTTSHLPGEYEFSVTFQDPKSGTWETQSLMFEVE